MKLFNKKYILNPLHDKSKEGRRSFFRKAAAALAGATILGSAGELLAMKSKTGYVYVKQDGEVINNYTPSSGDTPYLGEIGLFAFSYAPHNWAMCNGQILAINTNSALFSLLGNYFGGNGTTTFALPDLRGRAPMHNGQGPGLSNYPMGLQAGAESVTLAVNNLPAHTHNIQAYSGTGGELSPANNFIAGYDEGVRTFGSSAADVMNAASVSNTGGGQAHNNIQPYLVLNYCIAMQGIFPTQT
jgi:microcystin-dependent protein